jgi:hypothetical protein
MPAGLQIFNTSGTIQIDENYQNYMLLAKGTVTSGSLLDDAGLPINGVQVFTSSVTEFVAVRGSDRVALHSILPSGAGLRYVFAAPFGSSVTYYRYALGVNSAQPYGLQVFNAAGALVFDAMCPSMRIETILNGPDYAAFFGDWVWNASKQYAVAYGAWSGSIGMDVPPVGTQLLIEYWRSSPSATAIAGGLRFSLNSRYWTRSQMVTSAPANPAYKFGKFQALIVEVTGQ